MKVLTEKSPYAGFGTQVYTVVPLSDAFVRAIWENVADDFLPFEVNVTTNYDIYLDYPTNKKVQCAIADFGKPGWRGVAFVGSFGNGNSCLVDLDDDPGMDDTYMYRTPSHEIGHTLGLSHDGGNGDPYYDGHGEYVPIMGSGNKMVAQWSKGEYSSANNNEDDIAIMSSRIKTAKDDYTDVRELIINNNGTVDPLSIRRFYSV